jgi:hypothetical protein
MQRKTVFETYTYMLFDVSFHGFSDTTICLLIKEDLAFFLATELIRQAPEGKVVVTGGGFISEDQADSNDKSLNLDNLKSTHEEADVAHDSPHASL